MMLLSSDTLLYEKDEAQMLIGQHITYSFCNIDSPICLGNRVCSQVMLMLSGIDKLFSWMQQTRLFL